MSPSILRIRCPTEYFDLTGTGRKACAPIVLGSPIWSGGSVERWVRRGEGDPEIAEALRWEAGGEWD